MKEMIKKIVGFAGPFKKVIFNLLGFLVLMEAFSMLSPYFYGKVIDSIIGGEPISHTIKLVLLSGLVLLFSNITEFLKSRYDLKKFNFDFYAYVAHKTLGKFFGFSVGQHVNQNSGIKQRVIKRGENDLNQLVYSSIYDILPTLIRIILVTGALLFMVPIIGVIVLVVDLVFLAISLWINKIIKPSLEKYKDYETNEGKFYGELLRNVELVQVSAQEKKIRDEYKGLLGELNDFGKKMWLRFVSLSLIREFLMTIANVVVLSVGVFLVYKKVYTPGYLVIIFGWTSIVFGNLWRIGGIHRRVTDQIVSIKKYFTMIEVEPDIKESAHPVVLEKLQGKIEFKNVLFKYPKRKYVEDEGDAEGVDDKHKKHAEEKGLPNALDGVSFTIEPGQKVAFVGHSGAGKSTLAHLLLRAYDPTSGQITVDGVDLKELQLKSYRRQIGLVEQVVSLFDNTLKYNILFGVADEDLNPSDKHLEKIAKLACIDKFYDRLEDKFETMIGEKGVKLSGGERQRVGIARALIKEPKILIFDEATSSLDTENEALIHQAIEKASKGRTTITIAHRLSTVKDADKIFVMDKGKLIGQGKHDELMKKCKQYKNLINKQVVTMV